METNIWDKFALSYDKILSNWSLYSDLRVNILEHLKDSNIVLEQGCGTGIIAIDLAKENKDVFGIDNNCSMLNVAKKNNSFNNLHLQEGNAMDLQFEEDFFDAVVSNNVIFYVNNPIKLIQEAYRVLKPNGKIVISGPKPDYINNSNNVNNLIIHITEEFKNKGIEDLLKQDLKNFIDCSILLQKKGIQNVYEVEQITNILKSTRFKREIFASGEMYLGFCYQVILQK